LGISRCGKIIDGEQIKKFSVKKKKEKKNEKIV